MKKTLAIALTFMMGLVIFTACEETGSFIDNDDSSSQVSNVGTDEVSFGSLNWCWGGYNGKGAKDIVCKIKNLKISNSGMSYSWCQSDSWKLMGAASKTDASFLACLFVKQNGKWNGGKIDWCSESRLTRDFINPNSGYNGWDKNAIANGKEFAFVFVKGNRRTNVLYFSR